MVLICALPIFVIRAQPYDDHAIRELLPPDCPAPCLMGIRPGVHSLSEGVYFLEAHDWVATRLEDMPSVVRLSVFYESGVPRTDIRWHWNSDLPLWINPSERGTLTVENFNVKMMTIDTYLTVGDIALTLGDPDAVWYRDMRERQFEYSAWYANQQMLITTQGVCPLRHVYHSPVRIRLYASPPPMSEPESGVCG
jgi:hypothetical protein